MKKRVHWIMFALGIWTIVSPWVFGYSFITPALWSSVVVGTLIAMLSLRNMWRDSLDVPLQ